ncbi:MAG: SDR family oxidoreductase [Burkholderiales bacterium]|nr:SDR family oxidoreductase [Burkholderiales bacterium]
MTADAAGDVLVTGATGFLGGAVAAELVGGPHWARTRLLVRAPDRASGRDRVREALRRFAVAPALLEAVGEENIVPGDLRDAAAACADPALRQVRRVLNCAAVASFADHPQLWPVNVEGTFAFARRLLEVAPLERFVQVGTAMCVGPDAPGAVPEAWAAPAPVRHLVPYTRTKEVIEARLRDELPALPLVVARPTIVVGHTRLGVAPSPSIYWVFRAAQLLERFTCALSDRIDVVPVDWVARALIALTTKPALAHRFYHLSAGPARASTFAELDVAMARGRGVAPVDGRYRQIPAAELDTMRGEFRERLGPCNPRIMARALKLYGAFASLDMTFHSEHLADEGIDPPPPFAAYAGVCAASAESATIAEQMVADFK